MRNHKAATLCAALPIASAFLTFSTPGAHPVPSPPAITGEVLNWLGAPIYYRLPAPSPLGKMLF